MYRSNTVFTPGMTAKIILQIILEEIHPDISWNQNLSLNTATW
jgi:hypothetical protein